MLFPAWIYQAASWNEDVIFLLDGESRFADCNPRWDQFAAENGGHGILRREILGKPILDYVPEVLRTFYVQKYWFAKRSPGWLPLDYECSSPEKIRLYRMSMMAVGEGLLVVNHLRLEEKTPIHPPVTRQEKALYFSAEGFGTMCAYCRKTRRRESPTVWEWIPEFLRDSSLKVSHGLCPGCAAYLYP